MESADGAAVAATTISLFALALALRNRRADIAREEAYKVRARVWEVLNGEPGLRTIEALDENDGKTDIRIRLLGRTAEQLGVAGAPMLGHKLEHVLEEPWGSNTSDKSRSTRSDFVTSATEFMKPA